MKSRKENRKVQGAAGWLVAMVLGFGGLLPFGHSSQTHAASLAPAAPVASSTPILLIVNAAAPNLFSGYLAEILKSEGLNTFDVVTLSTLTASDLLGHDVTILVETPLSAPQAALLTSYVNGGGRLVAMRPDAQIAQLFGLQAKAGELDSAYMSIDQTATLDGGTPGSGLPTAALQYHSIADLYPVQASAVPLARLFTNATTPSTYPAVVRFASGTGIGVAFTYDLARNVVLTRQGNSAWSTTVTNTNDLFRPHGSATWLDLNLANVPQADEHQRLFARIVSQLATASRPLPQLWYFPNKAKSVLLATANANANPIAYMNDVVTSVNARGGKTTFFIAIGGLEPTDVQGLLAAGHNVSPWITAARTDPTYPTYTISSLQQGFDIQTNWYNLTMGVPPSATVRTAARAWTGWADAAQFAANKGYGLDLSFGTVGAWLQQPNGTWAHGYTNGSGRPMKFSSATGSVLPVYQQATELSDEQFFGDVNPSGENLTVANALNISRRQIDDSLNGNYAAVVAETQVATYRFSSGYTGSPRAWFEGTLDYATSKGMPILTGQQWWTFNTARDSARYTEITWDNTAGKLTFNMAVSATAGVSLTTLLPIIYKGRSLQQVLVDGVSTSFSVDNVKATNFAWVAVPAGPHSFEASYVPDTAIGNLTASVTTSAPRVLFQLIQFAASVDAGTNVTYLWDFGDGISGSGPNPTHAYQQYGSGGAYTVKVTATNAAGSRTASVVINLALPPVGFMPVISK